MLQRLHGCLGRIGEGCQRPGGRDGTVVAGKARVMRLVTPGTVAGRESPAVPAVPGEAARVADTVGLVDQSETAVVQEVIRILVANAARIEAEKRSGRRRADHRNL